MNAFDALLLGVLEGFTEFLPISSTGHLILASHLLGLDQSGFLKTFQVAIQLGAIAAVVILYLRQFFRISVLTRLFVGFIPTGIIGFTLYPFIKGYLLGNPFVVASALIIGGVALIVIERYVGKKFAAAEEADVATLSYKNAFLVGLFQTLAIVPGVSRSGATVAGGLMLGIHRATLLSFTFLLAVPTMVVATGYDLYKNPDVLSSGNFDLLAIGFAAAFIVALLTMKAAIAFVRKHGFTPFGYYRIVLGLLFLLFVL